jgi:hypothetical protein
MAAEYVPPRYPVLTFIAARGMALAVAFGALALAGGLLIAWLAGLWLLVPVAIVIAAIAYVLFASYVELARIVIDTLVPR